MVQHFLSARHSFQWLTGHWDLLDFCLLKQPFTHWIFWNFSNSTNSLLTQWNRTMCPKLILSKQPNPLGPFIRTFPTVLSSTLVSSIRTWASVGLQHKQTIINPLAYFRIITISPYSFMQLLLYSMMRISNSVGHTGACSGWNLSIELL